MRLLHEVRSVLMTCVFIARSPQSQLRNHEKEHENLTSDPAALTATEVMTTMEEAEQEVGGKQVFYGLL